MLLESNLSISPPSPHCVGFFLQSKGGILSKACDYIQELRQSNHRLSEELQGLDQLQLDNDVLRQQVRPPPSVQPSSTSIALTQFGTPYFAFQREGFIFFSSPVDVPVSPGTWLYQLFYFTPLTASFLCQVEDLKNKNLLLRAQLRHHGVEVVIKNDSN